MKVYISVALCASQSDTLALRNLNWTCTSCGMSSSRRFSVQRHIENPNIHYGSGQAIPFVEYSIGRREGRYQPQQVPQFAPSKAPFLDKMREKIAIEVQNQIVKEVAKRMFSKIPANDPRYDILESMARQYISEKGIDELLKILRNQV